MLKVHSAQFVKSSPDYRDCPPSRLPEYAFIGRSNVGKSSLINMLTNRKNLAKISRKPGKTRLINHFIINDQWYLVDLPGYGWAQVSKQERKKWQKNIRDYLMNRPSLYCVFVLIDSRLEPQNIDIEFINHLGEQQVSLVLVYTKSDKQSAGQTTRNQVMMQNKLKEKWEELPRFFVTSAQKKLGGDELLAFIDEINQKS